MSRRSNIFLRALSTEAESTDGKATQEIEYMFYAKVDSAQALLNAVSCEIQEQWGLWQDKTEKNAGSGSNRVRKTITRSIVAGALTTDNEQVQYVMTTKLKRADGTSIEVPQPSSEDGLKAFKILAESGMIKHRYRFPVMTTPGANHLMTGATKAVTNHEDVLFWEVDMFVEPGESMFSTKYIGWCKIDLEVPSLDTPIPPMPHGFTDMFNPKGENLTPEQQSIADKLQGYLNLPNPHLKQVYTDVV